MKAPVVIVAFLAFLSQPVLSDSDCFDTGGHYAPPCEDNVESPEVIISSEPSHAPSPSPTAAPTAGPTAEPTSVPSSVPSDTPSTPPTSGPTNFPTASPTNAPTSSPTQTTCTAAGGIYGNIDSEAINTVEYGYELETTVGENSIETFILPDLERAIVESVLSEVFNECNPSRRNLRVTRKLDVTGVSKNPDDLILENVNCENVADGNTCVVVSGELTIFSTDSASGDVAQESVRNAIETTMDQGGFDGVNPDIVRVSYVTLDGDTNGVEGGDKSKVGGRDSPTMMVGLLVAAGVLVAAVLGVAYKRRQTDTEENTEIGQGTQTL